MRGSTAGISDGLKGSSKLHYTFITILDQVISAAIISPLVVSYWRGSWGLMDHFAFPDEPRRSVTVSIVLGYGGTLFFTIFQKVRPEKIHPDVHRISYYVLSRVYTAIFAFVCVNSWRAAWVGLDVYTPVEPYTVSLITCISVLCLVFTRTSRNLSAPPFAVVTDRYDGYFEAPTLMKTSSERLWFYLLDCVLSVCFIGTLVVFVWRGVWCLLDIYLYPGYPAKSALASLSIGYAIVVLVFVLQPPMKYMARTFKGIPRLIVVDAYQLLSFMGTLNVWRGVWMALNTHFLTENPGLSYFLSHTLSFIMLVLINSSNSLLVRGVYIDGEENGEMCVDLPCYYIRLFFQTRRKKKYIKASRKSKQALADEETFSLEPGQRDIQIVNNIRRNSSAEINTA